MALIKCTECGHMVSDKADCCPNCGCPLEKKIYCEECGQELLIKDAICPNCGCPARDYSAKDGAEPNNQYQYSYSEQGVEGSLNQNKKFPRKAIFIGSLVLICMIVLLSLFSNLNSDNTYKIFLYSDNTGVLEDNNGNRVCGVEVFGSRKEPINITLSQSVNIFGKNVDHLYISDGYIYTDYGDYLDDEYDDNIKKGIAVEKQEKDGTIIFSFSDKTNTNSQINGTTKENKIVTEIQEVKTVKEAGKLINGTTWHHTENLSTSKIKCWVKVSFKNGRFTSYYAKPSDGKWTQGGSGNYKISEGRFANTGTKYISVCWKDEMKLDGRINYPCEFYFVLNDFQLHIGSEFMDGLARMNDYFKGDYFNVRNQIDIAVEMEFGDYSWE